MTRQERKLLILVPLILAILTCSLTFIGSITSQALAVFLVHIPDIMSILIGFSISVISIIAAMEGNTINSLMRESTNELDENKEPKYKYRMIGNEKISYKQWLLINFSHNLYYQIATLLGFFLISLIRQLIARSMIVDMGVLMLFVFLVLRIFFGMVYSVAYMYNLYVFGK